MTRTRYASFMREDRPWPAHSTFGDRCRFVRNTLLRTPHHAMIVSTVGALENKLSPGRLVELFPGRLFDTAVFFAKQVPDGEWVPDVDHVMNAVPFPQFEPARDDTHANELHEQMVALVRDTIVRLEKHTPLRGTIDRH